MRREVKYGAASRVDFLLEGDGRPPVYVEVKNVHLMRKPGLAEFPDCATARGAKHMRELADMVRGGARACVVFLIQMRADRFTLAADLDPAYARAFGDAMAAGVEAHRARVRGVARRRRDRAARARSSVALVDDVGARAQDFAIAVVEDQLAAGRRSSAR